MIQHKPDPNIKVGIFIPTMNRSEFIIRQLTYYASVNCTHTIYIADSSKSEEHLVKTKKSIEKFKDRLEIYYDHYPYYGQVESTYRTLTKIKEKYACVIGDDDYQIPDSLTKCSEFLENHPDYATASGLAVSFRLKNNSVYGELLRLADYPRFEIEASSAGERLKEFFSNYYVPLFSVNRTKNMLKNWEGLDEMKDKSFSAEIMPSAMSIIDGKSKVIDCLSLIRQIHDSHYILPNSFDWITSPEWNESYKIFEDEVSKNISNKDNISLEAATKVTRRSFWSYLQKYLAKEYYQRYPNSKRDFSYKNFLIHARSKIARTFPILKKIYRMQIKPQMTGKKELNYEVLQPKSKYYKDFKPVMDSFIGQIKT